MWQKPVLVEDHPVSTKTETFTSIHKFVEDAVAVDESGFFEQIVKVHVSLQGGPKIVERDTFVK